MLGVMFTLVNIGEHAGGGIPDMVKKWTGAGHGRPVLGEQVNPELSGISLPLAVGFGDNDAGNVGNGIVKTEEQVLHLIAGNPKISAQDIADRLGISRRRIERVMAALREEGILIREGGTRGRWIISRNR